MWCSTSLLVTLFTCNLATAYPNILPQHQQELLQPPPGIKLDDNLHFQSTIRDVLLANQIIPQVLDDFEPTYYIQLSYPKHHESVLLGNDIPVKAVKKRPVFTFHPLTGPSSYGDLQNDKNLTFTLVLTDPDALSRKHPVKSEMCHWIITNLTTPIGRGCEIEWPSPVDFADEIETVAVDDERYLDDSDFLGAGRKPGELEGYLPPGPPKKTGPHRYVFVLLEGDSSNVKSPKERPHWGYGKERHGVRDWAKENDLAVVGVNFFFAQHRKQ